MENIAENSNQIVLPVWFTSWGATVTAAIAFQVRALVAPLAIDHRLRVAAIISNEYFQTRVIATLIGIIALVTVRLS